MISDDTGQFIPAFPIRAAQHRDQVPHFGIPGFDGFDQCDVHAKRLLVLPLPENAVQ